MKYLLVGKTGFFDTLAVASGFTDAGDVTESPYFGDLTRENSGAIVRDSGDQDNELYVCGYKFPKIVKTMVRELNTLSRVNDHNRLQVIPVSVRGQNMTWFLTRLANLPLIGPFFLDWAKSRTLARRHYLYQVGQDLAELNGFGQQVHYRGEMAAKPRSE